MDVVSPSMEQPDCVTFTIKLQPQVDLEIVGVGAASQVYKVDDYIVLKACRVYEHPTSDVSARDQWFYASETLFHSNLMKDERTVMRLLEKRSHSNIVEAIDTDHDEGIYLRRYLSLSELEVPAQRGRVLWYQDITRGLLHIHKLGIAHSDLRIDNVLFDHHGHAFLCDFSAASPFGQFNPARPLPDLPVPINGLSEVVSDATDRFAMGSLIFQMEHNTNPKLSVDDNGSLVLPEVRTGHNHIDAIIRKAWLGQYNSTIQMLKDLESLEFNTIRDINSPITHTVSRKALRDRVRYWREQRRRHVGKQLLNYEPQRLGFFCLLNLMDSFRLHSPGAANRRPTTSLGTSS